MTARRFTGKVYEWHHYKSIKFILEQFSLASGHFGEFEQFRIDRMRFARTGSRWRVDWSVVCNGKCAWLTATGPDPVLAFSLAFADFLESPNAVDVYWQSVG